MDSNDDGIGDLQGKLTITLFDIYSSKVKSSNE